MTNPLRLAPPFYNETILAEAVEKGRLEVEAGSEVPFEKLEDVSTWVELTRILRDSLSKALNE